MNQLKHSDISQRDWLLCVALMVGLGIAVMLGHNIARENHIQQASLVLKNRVALDLADLGLNSPVIISTRENNNIRRYGRELNQQLDANRFPLRLAELNGFQVFDLGDYQPIEVNLKGPRREVDLTFAILLPRFKVAVFLLPLLFTGLFLGLLRFKGIQKQRIVEKQKSDVIEKDPVLIIDLRERTLYFDKDEAVKTTLSNKPLCFYIAMLKYCNSEDEPQLFHNKMLPESFVELANKYFYRLLELGHSRRKRPDFDSNIDKMLSEIRAALDEILDGNSELKTRFYPQKAQGEGSRSKLHNFALRQIQESHFQLLGD